MCEERYQEKQGVEQTLNIVVKDSIFLESIITLQSKPLENQSLIGAVSVILDRETLVTRGINSLSFEFA